MRFWSCVLSHSARYARADWVQVRVTLAVDAPMLVKLSIATANMLAVHHECREKLRSMGHRYGQSGEDVDPSGELSAAHGSPSRLSGGYIRKHPSRETSESAVKTWTDVGDDTETHLRLSAS